MWSAVTTCLQNALRDKVAPALVVLCWRGEEIVFSDAIGQCDQQTVFDLASLTKPLATTLLALSLPWSGTLQTLWGSAVPDDKKNITIEQLLNHSSGLPAWMPYYEFLLKQNSADKKLALKQKLLQEPLAYLPGSQALYSDLGFMLLGLILEEQGAAGLDSLWQQACQQLEIQQPPFYLPIGGPVPNNLAPCGSQPLLGRMQISGQVEDENAWAMGGVAAHAGLFGTAGSVKEVLQKAFKVNAAKKLWPPTLLNKIYNPDSFTPGSTRSAGFDTPDGLNSSAGHNYPAGLIGHLGFSGVSFWYQPFYDIGVVLLTNRVAYGRDNWKIRQLRPALHSLIWPLLKYSDRT